MKGMFSSSGSCVICSLRASQWFQCFSGVQTAEQVNGELCDYSWVFILFGANFGFSYGMEWFSVR